MTSFDDILARLRGVKQTGSGHVAFCPAHDDVKEQSLSIKQGGDGRILLHCFTGCTFKDIAQALKLEERDLFPATNAQGSGSPVPTNATPYDVRDGSGAIIARHVRQEYSDGPKKYLWFQPDGTPGLAGVKTAGLPLYGAHLLVKCEPGTLVPVAEGEKAAQALINKGIVAVATVTGAAGTPSSESLSILRAYGVVPVLWPDNDEPGHQHMNRVGARLANMDLQPRILSWPEAPKGGDAADYAGDVQQLIDASLPWKPPIGLESIEKAGFMGARLVWAKDVAPEDVKWLWRPYLPLGKLTLFDGDPGLGKSWVSLAIVTAISLGRGLPNYKPFEPGVALVASAEDGKADTLRPRLDAMGADVTRIAFVDGLFTMDEEGLNLLDSWMRETHPALVVLDPLVGYMGAKVDMHRANETRHVMAAVGALAERHQTAIMAIRHLTKSGPGGKAIYRGQGNIDLLGAARSGILAGSDPQQPQNRAIIHWKCNLAAEGPSIGYKIEENDDGRGLFSWTGVSELTKERVLAVNTDEDARPALIEAEEFLRETLSQGELKASEVTAAARQVAIADQTLKRARWSLRIVAKPIREPGQNGVRGWLWSLPEGGEYQRHLEEGGEQPT